MTSRITRASRTIVATGALAIALAAAPALAQEGSAPPEQTPQPVAAPAQDPNEIVVTAQFRQQNLQDTPIAITAVNSAMLEARSQTDLAQVASQAPNVTLRPLGGSFGPALGASIRGIGQFDFDPAVEPGVGIYIHDVYYSSLTGAQFELLDLDRIEILRGPQGTLAGKNSIGGSIRLISKKPTGDSGGYISATYGSRNRLDLRASDDFTLVKDKLFMRLSGVAHRQDGYVKVLDFQCANPSSTPRLPTNTSNKNCVIGHEGGKNNQAVRGVLRFVASDALEFTAIGDYTHDDSEGPAVTLLATSNIPNLDFGVPYDNRFIPSSRYVSYATFNIRGGQFPGYGDFSAENRSRYGGWGGSFTADWKLGDNLALKSITGVRKFHTHFSGDPDVSPLSLILSDERLRARQTSQELRLTGQALDELLDFTVGGYYFDSRIRYSNREDFPYIGVPGYDFLGDDPVDDTTEAVFGHVELHPARAMTITGGIRYTHDKKTYNYTRTNPDGSFNPAVGALNGLAGTYRGSRVDYRVGVDYHLTDDIMAYVQRSTGFKGGGVNPRPYIPSQVQSFNAEQVTANEVGLKTELFDRKMRFNVSAFYNRYTDIQITLLTCPQYNPPGFPANFPCAIPANAGNATIKGVEMETDAHPVRGLLIDGSASYINTSNTYIDPLAGGPTQPSGPQPGDRIANTPTWKLSGGIQYEIPLDEHGSLTPRFDAAYQSHEFTGSTGNGSRSRIDGYTLLNARLTYRTPSKAWEASLEVVNLTNKFYYVTKVDPRSFLWAQPSEPRTWALTLKRNL